MHYAVQHFFVWPDTLIIAQEAANLGKKAFNYFL